MENGELPEIALRREIEEELCYAVGVLEPLPPVQHVYDFGVIRLLPFLGRCETRPAMRLTEHMDGKWVALAEWKTLDWAPADISVIQRILDSEKKR